jgi:5-methylcytosine-specific restriction enzyme subunit McrC
LSTNNKFNQIIKTTLLNLTKEKSVKRETRLKLRNILRFFDEVDNINLSDVKWSQLRFQRNNKPYEMLLNICYFVYTESILSHNSGDKKVMAFSDENMAKVYEKFILEYYKRHHHELSASAAEIKWNLDEDFAEPVIRYLPKMQSDITLRHNGFTLIIDAKYYSKNMQQQFDKNTLINGNLYQIYTYVKNEDKASSGNVAGMLLYAKTNSDIIPVADFSTGGNRISVKTLNLDADFDEIKQQLDKIVDDYFYKNDSKQGATA